MIFLYDKTILITRPKDQAKSLADAIGNYGGRSIILPMFEIVQYPNVANCDFSSFDTLFQTINPQDIVIFTSANAVAAVANSITFFPAQALVLAIGPGTAQALKQIKIAVNEIPQEHNSEGLLQLAVLHNVTNRRIFILCGENPRPLLKEALSKRGAFVEEVFCYQRQPILYSISELKAALEPADYVICTSQEGLSQLISVLTPGLLSLLCQRKLIVISLKMQILAKQFNLYAEVSRGASDVAILEVLLRLTNSDIKSEWPIEPK